MLTKEFLSEKLSAGFPELKFEISEFRDEITVKLSKSFIVTVCDYLKNTEGLQFNYLEDITAIDWARKKERFEVVYILFSIDLKQRLKVKVGVEEKDAKVDSVSVIWKAANWFERETYDMYGITFNDHPDLRRMYMPEEFQHHPLRKDYPLMGHPGDLSLPQK